MPETLLSAWARARKVLGAIEGLDTPTFEARLFVEAATGASRMDILTDPYREIAAAATAKLDDMLARRAKREPAWQILGYRDFWTLRLAISPAVLTPRPETEVLVKTALEIMKPDARVLDLGTGSGAIMLAILSERPLAHGIGVDRSEEALVFARANGAALGLGARVAWRAGDWGAGLEGPFDLIVSNPPYIRSGAIGQLEPEVAAYEPRLALDGGADGLDAYRAIFPEMTRLLAPDGYWAVEIGRGQAEAAWALADQARVRPLGAKDDLAGVTRVVYGRR
jgi:release factor glutamine methyltransferase